VGKLQAKISINKAKGVVEHQWVDVFDGQGEMVVQFHPKF